MDPRPRRLHTTSGRRLRIAQGVNRDVLDLGLPTATELLDPITPGERSAGRRCAQEVARGVRRLPVAEIQDLTIAVLTCRRAPPDARDSDRLAPECLRSASPIWRRSSAVAAPPPRRCSPRGDSIWSCPEWARSTACATTATPARPGRHRLLGGGDLREPLHQRQVRPARLRREARHEVAEVVLGKGSVRVNLSGRGTPFRAG